MARSIVLRYDHSAVAIAAEILRREKAEGADRRHLARHSPLAIEAPARTDGLRRILDQRQFRHRRAIALDGRHLAEEIDRHHGPASGS